MRFLGRRGAVEKATEAQRNPYVDRLSSSDAAHLAATGKQQTVGTLGVS